MAPEAIPRNRWTEKSDVWAFGVFLWEVVTMGAVPYQSLGIYEDDRAVQAGVCSGQLRLPQPHGCSNEIYAIMMRCWESTAAQRPTFRELRIFLLEAIVNDARNRDCAGPAAPLSLSDVNHVSESSLSSVGMTSTTLLFPINLPNYSLEGVHRRL